MNDLSWIERTEVVREGDEAKCAFEANPGWHLLHVTGGLHGPVEYVFGWGDPPSQSPEERIAEQLENIARLMWEARHVWPG